MNEWVIEINKSWANDEKAYAPIKVNPVRGVEKMVGIWTQYLKNLNMPQKGSSFWSNNMKK